MVTLLAGHAFSPSKEMALDQLMLNQATKMDRSSIPKLNGIAVSNPKLNRTAASEETLMLHALLTANL